jgi:plastocyanin
LRRSLVATAAVLATVVIASGCNSKLLRPPAIIFADSGEFAVKTSIRGEGDKYPSVFTAFVPSQVPLHPGDAVNFQLQDTGEPHAVAVGTLVDAAVTGADGLGPTATLKQIEGLKPMKKVPSVMPLSPKGKVPELNASAAQRCFLESGSPPNSPTGGAAACEEAGQPDFNGRQPFFSSGLLEEGEPFRIKLAADIAPASYRFMCLVHRSTMTGTIEVRPKDVERPSVAELRTQAEAEEKEVAASLEPSARVAGVKAFDAKGAGPVFAGTGPLGLSRGFITAFIGDEVKVAVDTPLVWKVNRTHTISFNPSREAKDGFILEGSDGTRLNEDVWNPVGSKRAPAGLFRIPPAKKSYKINGGTWSGEDAWSSGVIQATAGTAVSYSMRFSKAGTYKYTCLIHDSMRGRVVVE